MTGSSRRPALLAALCGLAGLPPVAARAQAVTAPLPRVTLNFGHLSGGSHHIQGDTVHVNYGGMLTVTSPHLEGDPATSVYDFTGGVYAHANDTTLTGSRLHYDGAQQFAVAEGATLVRRPLTIRSPHVVFQPDLTTATDASLTTANPGDKPDVEVRAHTVFATPVRGRDGTPTGREHLDMREASLYLLHNRLLTLRRFQTTVGGSRQRPNQQRPHPTFGYSQNYGYFLGYGSQTTVSKYPLLYNVLLSQRSKPQINLMSGQTLFSGPGLHPESPPPPAPPLTPHLAALKVMTTALTPPLPPGDPLLFHDYLPGGNLFLLFNGPPSSSVNLNEQLLYHVPELGSGRHDLYVTAYPEVTLSGVLPLTHTYALPAPGDPHVFRQYLRNFVLDSYAAVDVGHFNELPSGTDAYRLREQAGLFTQPFLIAPNTLVQPAFNLISNHYTGTSLGYSYSQFSLGVNHYFSDFSALGVRYTVSHVNGRSPFNFDGLNSARQMDARLQVGNHRLALAATVSYDLVYSRTIDYTFAAALGLHGVTPVLSYEYFTRSIGINIVIPGLNF